MRSNPLRPISWTASEIVAERIVRRLYLPPPKAMSWRDYAIREIAWRSAPRLVHGESHESMENGIISRHRWSKRDLAQARMLLEGALAAFARQSEARPCAAVVH